MEMLSGIEAYHHFS